MRLQIDRFSLLSYPQNMSNPNSLKGAKLAEMRNYC